MKFILKDKSEFDVASFMNDNGKAIVGTSAKQWFNNIPLEIFQKQGMNLKIKDMQTGEDETFDISSFLRDNKIDVDYDATYQRQTEEAKKAKRQANIQENIKEFENYNKLLEEQGAGEALKKSLFPFQWKREQNIAKGKDDPSILKDVLAASMDFFSMVPRQAIAAGEEALFRASDGQRGRPFVVSLGRHADYGADVNPETGEEETLSDHMSNLAEAMRVDPGGVLADLGIESVRDPLTGVHAAAAIASFGSTGTISASLQGSKMAAMIGKIAKKYKYISAPAVATAKFAYKLNDKIKKSNVAVKFASSVLGEGVEGGIQGVITNYALGEDKNAWNTFVIEGVEEAIFGAGMFVLKDGTMSAIGKAWNTMDKEQKANQMHNLRERYQQLQAAGIEPTPENLYAEVNTSPTAETIQIPPTTTGQRSPSILNVGPQTQIQQILKAENEAKQSTPITSQLPPGVSRNDIIKDIYNPAHESVAKANFRIEMDETTRKVKRDLNKIDQIQTNAEKSYRSELENIVKETETEMIQEDMKDDAERKKNLDDTQKLLGSIIDPTTETKFDAWVKVFGKEMSVDEQLAGFEEFRIAEQQRLEETKKRIYPQESTAEEKPAETHLKMREEPGPIEISPEQLMGDLEIEPWSLTKEEYMKEHPGPEGEAAHRSIIQKAVNAKKDIPPEVLAAYPDVKPGAFDEGKLETNISDVASRMDYLFGKKEPVVEAEVQTDKPRKIKGGKTLIGKNSKGMEVYEDEQGVRSYNEGGILVGEAVSITPTKSGVKVSRTGTRSLEYEVVPEKPQAPATAETKFVNIVDESKLEEIKARINAKLNPGRLYSNPGFDPELWTDMVHMGMIYAQKGVNNFVDWSLRMTEDLGQKAKPFLQSVYNALQAYPRNVKFDPEVAVKLFEIGGITRQKNGMEKNHIEQVLVESFGDRAKIFTDFIHEGLEQYPSIEQIQEMNYESEEAIVQSEPQPSGAFTADMGEVGETGGGEVPGIEPGGEVKPDIRPVDGDVPGDVSPYSLEESESEGEPQKALAQDVYVRQNIDLRNLPPVEMGPAARRKINLQSEEILERVRRDPASLTQEDRLILRQYTGQGGLNISQLTDEELEGTLNQHYTSYAVAKATWDIIESLGFNLRGIEALEPTAGVGNFAGMAPREIKWRLNEVDKTAGEIMNLLYPDAENSISPFETYVGPQKDLVISNVPFLEHRGKYAAKEDNPRYKGIKSLHNYIMMKAVDQVRDNGLAVFITSTWTMDAKNPEFRKQLNQKAEAIAVVRLPMGAFQKNTQYAGSADILILRKRTATEMQQETAEERQQEEFVNSIPVIAPQADGTGKATTRSGWFEVHRSQALGDWKYGTSRGGLASSTALNVDKADFDASLQENLRNVIKELSGKYYPAAGAMLSENMIGIGEDLGTANSATPKFGLEEKNGIISKADNKGRLRRLRPETFTIKEKGRLVKTNDWGKRSFSDKHLSLIIKLMDTAKSLRDGVAEGINVKHLQDRAKSLLSQYQSLPRYYKQPILKQGKKEVILFPGVNHKQIGTKRVGLQFKHNPLIAYAGMDNRFWLLRSLYNKQLDGLSDLVTKKPQLNVATEPKKGDTKTAEGVVDYLMEKYGVFRTQDALEVWEGDTDAFHNAMLAHPKLNWDGNEFVHDNDYLVGNLRDKIAYSKKMKLNRQLEKLEASLPPRITRENIDKNPISTWWDYEALSAFGHELQILGRGLRIERFQEGLRTRFRAISGQGENAKPYNPNRDDPLFDFVEIVLNQKNKMIPDPNDLSDKPRMIEDLKSTDEIRKRYREAFSNWVSNPQNTHTARAVDNFNTNFNSKSIRDYSTEKLFIKGLSPEISGRKIIPHGVQLAVVRMVANQGGGIAALDVGYGKTLAAVFAFAYAKQLGKFKKCLTCVPAQTVGMWDMNFNEVLRGSNVKVIRSKPAAVTRADFMDAVANDYDVIITTHQALKKIPLRKSEVYINEEIKEVRQILLKLESEKAAEGKKKRSVDAQRKSVQKRLDKLQSKLEINLKAEKDLVGGMFFEDLGVDFLILDEAHNHKNTFEHTNEYADKRFLKLGAESSHLADDMVHKTRYLHEINNRGGVLALTATPTPNNPIEVYSMIKFVAPWEWKQRGINTVDDFVRDFVDIGPIDQSSLSGISYAKEGIIGYKNQAALRDITHSWIDYQEATPATQEGRPESKDIVKIVEPNDAQLNLLGEMAYLSSLSFKQLMQLKINPVTLTTRAKAIATDPGMDDPSLVDEYPNIYDRSPKIRQALDDLREEYNAYPDRVNIVWLENYNVRDFRPMLNEGGLQVEWPSGFGAVFNDEGELIYPKWFKDLSPAEQVKVERLMTGPVNPSVWDSRFLNQKGIPKDFTIDTIEKYKPLFEEESGKVFISEVYIKQDLHQEIKKYAIEEIGMDPDRVFVVNGKSNNSPEDKTRLETLNELEQMSLIIGNKVAGEGLNLQNKGRASIRIDIPFEPKTDTQANGRLLRIRHDINDKVPVMLYKYATKYSADRRLYEILDKKRGWNKDLIYGKDDYVSNDINNAEENGAIDLSKELEVPQHIIEAVQLKYHIAMDAERLKGARKEARKMASAVERAKNNYADATRKIENANERIKNGQDAVAQKEKEVMEYNRAHPDKPKMLPDPYDATHWEEVIKNNMDAYTSGPKFIEEALEAYKPYEKIDTDYELNTLAQNILSDVRKNNWTSISQTIKDPSELELYKNFLEHTMPILYQAYPQLADMLAAKVLGRVPENPEVAAKEIYDYMEKNYETNSQAGFGNIKLLIGIAGAGLAIALPIQTTLGIAGLAGAAYAFRRVWRSKAGQIPAWSLRARLQQMPGYDRLDPLINQVNVEQQMRIAREESEFQAAVKGLTEEELLILPDAIESDTYRGTPNVMNAARAMQRLFLRVAVEAQRAGIPIPTDHNYYPRMLDFDMLQKMKADPDLMDKNAVHLLRSGQVTDVNEAYAILLNFFDGSAEMRSERRSAERNKIIQELVDRHPELNFQTLMTIFQRMKLKYGTQISGNLKYGRVAPKLLNEMYHRHPKEVMAKYLPGAWNTIIQKRILGDGNNNAVNQFLNGNFPVVDDNNSEREEVADWFHKQLEGGTFKSYGLASPKFSRAVRNYQVWTKLFTSHMAPFKNIAGAVNLALPLAGGRASFAGMVGGLRDATQGFSAARTAGAISDRMISEIYGMGENVEKTSWQKLKKFYKNWNQFGISEKFVRSFSFHAGRNMAQRLYLEAMDSENSRARDSYERLYSVIGKSRMTRAIMDNKLAPDDLDLFGVFMSNKIGGTTNAFDMARWMNTPEGKMIMQFHSMAMTQTTTFKNEILLPLLQGRKGSVETFLKWGLATGMSLTAIMAIQAGIYSMFGNEPPEKESSDNPWNWAWNLAMMSNMVFALGMMGDVAAGLDTPEGVTPLVGTFSGPTVNSIGSAVRDFGYLVSGDEERWKRLIRREVPGLNFLSKMGVIPGLQKNSE